jgi:DNA (cytosine-5)-methyltransferase 1
MRIEAVDLFCGAGGLSYGLEKAKIKVKAGIDFEPSCAYPFEKNIKKAKFFQYDISQLESEVVAEQYSEGSIRLLAGCAPCQPFSTLRNGTDRKGSDKWPLLNHFARLVKSVQPDLVTMENVPTLESQSIFNDFVQTLKDEGYLVSSSIVDASDYGVAQRRKRLVLLASKLGEIKLLSPQELGIKKKTVREVIGSLPKIEAGQVCVSDPLHKSRSMSPVNLQRIQISKPGGTWRDWPESLRAPCHQKESGATFSSVYARMEWDKPSPTITTQSTNFGTGRFGHPEQNRALSLREMAVLQSFPADYEFMEKDSPIAFSTIGKLIGNAVPVDLGYAIGETFKKHAKKYYKGDLK